MRPQQPVIVPIGQPLGSLYLDDDPIPDFRIRLGDQFFGLPPHQALMWETAHVTAAGRTTGHTRPELVALMSETFQRPTEDIEAAIESMLDFEVLVELPMTPDAMVEFAHDYRMMALLHGIGNAPDRLDGFGFGLGADGFSIAGLLDSEIISHAAAFGSLYDVCDYFAGVVVAQPQTSHLSSAEFLAEYVVGSLAPYLHTHTVCLDLSLANDDQEVGA